LNPGRTCLLGGTSKIVNRNAWGAICLPRVRQYVFGLNLDAKYGDGVAMELIYKAKKTLKIMPHEYKEKISYYESLVENLLKEKGLSLKK
jgi:hypothetical protein